MKHSFIVLIVLIFCSSATTFGQDSAVQRKMVKEWLPVPFGTIVKMKVEIVDGEQLNDKYHQSDFLFKVKSLDSLILSKAIIMDFRDETGKFPTDEMALYKYLLGKDTGVIDATVIEPMKKKYVGKEFTIIAYETGAFAGSPDGYFKYRPVTQDFGFRFMHYLVVIADLTKADK